MRKSLKNDDSIWVWGMGVVERRGAPRKIVRATAIIFGI
jgi:hypothetical protein